MHTFRVAAEMALLSAARGRVHDGAQLYHGHLAGRANYQSVGISLCFTVRNKRGGNKFAGKIWDPGIKVCGIIKCHVVIYPWTLQIIVQQPPPARFAHASEQPRTVSIIGCSIPLGIRNLKKTKFLVFFPRHHHLKRFLAQRQFQHATAVGRLAHWTLCSFAAVGTRAGSSS